jgi:ubiquinone biosynthesis protein
MVFVDGLFHADPHPGNLFVLPGGAIGLIDFGMVGEVTPAQREHLADLFVAVLSTRASSVAVALLRLTTKSRISDLDVLTADVARLLATIEGPGLEDVPMAELLVRLVAMMRKHGLQLQPSLASLVRTLVMVEGLGVQLDPTFRLGEALRPRAKALTAARFDLDSLLARLRSAGIDTALLGLDAPGRLRSLLERMDVDGLQVHLRAAELEPLVERIERVGSRLVVGMIAAALIGGIGQLSSSGAAPGSSSGRRLLRAGYLLVGGFSGYLAWTARHRRP